jgi:hypothetical protein
MNTLFNTKSIKAAIAMTPAQTCEYFNENEKLRLVMSVDDVSHDAGGKREFIHMNNVASRSHYY